MWARDVSVIQTLGKLRQEDLGFKSSLGHMQALGQPWSLWDPVSQSACLSIHPSYIHTCIHTCMHVLIWIAIALYWGGLYDFVFGQWLQLSVEIQYSSAPLFKACLVHCRTSVDWAIIRVPVTVVPFCLKYRILDDTVAFYLLMFCSTLGAIYVIDIG